MKGLRLLGVGSFFVILALLQLEVSAHEVVYRGRHHRSSHQRVLNDSQISCPILRGHGSDYSALNYLHEYRNFFGEIQSQLRQGECTIVYLGGDVYSKYSYITIDNNTIRWSTREERKILFKYYNSGHVQQYGDNCIFLSFEMIGHQPHVRFGRPFKIHI